MPPARSPWAASLRVPAVRVDPQTPPARPSSSRGTPSPVDRLAIAIAQSPTNTAAATDVAVLGPSAGRSRGGGGGALRGGRGGGLLRLRWAIRSVGYSTVPAVCGTPPMPLSRRSFALALALAPRPPSASASSRASRSTGASSPSPAAACFSRVRAPRSPPHPSPRSFPAKDARQRHPLGRELPTARCWTAVRAVRPPRPKGRHRPHRRRPGGRRRLTSRRCSRGCPPITSLGRIDDPALTTRFGAAMAAQLRGLGVNFDLAPVLDADQPRQHGGHMRTFGSRPSSPAHARPLVSGMLDGGVLACISTFGHGDTATDSPRTCRASPTTSRAWRPSSSSPSAR